MKGDIDGLKVGVQTGQIPGQEVPAEGNVATQIADLRARIDVLEARITDLMASGGAAKPGAGTPASANADPESLKKAYSRKHFKEVAQDAPSVIKKLKGKDRNEVLMIYGESLSKLNRHKEAALQFNEIVESKPEDKVLAQAKLRVADSLRAMGDKETSRLFYEEIAAKFPGTAEAEKAQKALKSKKK